MNIFIIKHLPVKLVGVIFMQTTVYKLKQKWYNEIVMIGGSYAR